MLGERRAPGLYNRAAYQGSGEGGEVALVVVEGGAGKSVGADGYG
ncbi:hypothetical protein [Paractinoplanes aksuensis]|nr:hypothetical protein [Actinoplanes aksuensis]